MKIKIIEKKFNNSTKDLYQLNINEDNMNKINKKIINYMCLNTTKDL